jgi:nitrite reductase (NO-forming)
VSDSAVRSALEPSHLGARTEQFGLELGVLWVRQGAGDDTIVLAPDLDPQQVALRVNDTVVGTYELAQIRLIRVVAGAGNDLIVVAPELPIVARLRGGPGNDMVAGGGGPDQIWGGDGHDSLQGNAGDDRLHGNAGNDSLSGGDGRDRIKGHDGEDSLLGGADNDRLWGDTGEDVLDGQEGVDRLHSGDGRDVLRNVQVEDVLGDGHEEDSLDDLSVPTGPPRTFGPSAGPSQTLGDIPAYLQRILNLDRLAEIARLPSDIPATPATGDPVQISIMAQEVLAEVAPGITLNYWTFEGTVPGPFLRIRQGDMVELTLSNHPSSLYHHSIDLHAVTGPGGGGAVTSVAPGESKTFRFRALNPGLYVYHCGHPNVAVHVAMGMYGMILVEPPEGLPPVDKEFYVMQGELYARGALGNRGFQLFDPDALFDARPAYIVFNGRVASLVDRTEASVGDRLRIFVGNGGVNLISSFHVVGEIFDRVYPEGAIGSDPHRNVQTTLIPAGGSSIVEFTVEVPGSYALVDHALARLDHGAWGLLMVTGDDNPDVFESLDGGGHDEAGH